MDQAHELPEGDIARQIAFYIADCADAAYLHGERYQDLGPNVDRLAVHFGLEPSEVQAQIAQLVTSGFVSVAAGADPDHSTIYPTNKTLQMHPSFADITDDEAQQFIASLRT
jgi:hypothetical protein